MLHMILHECGDEVVGMIVARLHPHVERDASGRASIHETKRQIGRSFSCSDILTLLSFTDLLRGLTSAA